MSLFDVIRYINTDLSDEDELKKLPIALLKLYWIKSIIGYTANPSIYPADARILSEWHCDEVYHHEQIKAFTNALKEYNNEPI